MRPHPIRWFFHSFIYRINLFIFFFLISFGIWLVSQLANLESSSLLSIIVICVSMHSEHLIAFLSKTSIIKLWVLPSIWIHLLKIKKNISPYYLLAPKHYFVFHTSYMVWRFVCYRLIWSFSLNIQQNAKIWANYFINNNGLDSRVDHEQTIKLTLKQLVFLSHTSSRIGWLLVWNKKDCYCWCISNGIYVLICCISSLSNFSNNNNRLFLRHFFSFGWFSSISFSYSSFASIFLCFFFLKKKTKKRRKNEKKKISVPLKLLKLLQLMLTFRRNRIGYRFDIIISLPT